MKPLMEKKFKEEIDHGSIAVTQYIEGDEADEMIDLSRTLLLLIRTQILTVLVPRLQLVTEKLKYSPGHTAVYEELTLNLFGLNLSLQIDLGYDLEIGAPVKDLLHLVVVEAIGPEWSKEATRHIVDWLMHKKFDDYYQKEAPCTVLDSASLGLGFGGADGVIILSGNMLGEAFFFHAAGTHYTS